MASLVDSWFHVGQVLMFSRVLDRKDLLKCDRFGNVTNPRQGARERRWQQDKPDSRNVRTEMAVSNSRPRNPAVYRKTGMEVGIAVIPIPSIVATGTMDCIPCRRRQQSREPSYRLRPKVRLLRSMGESYTTHC